MTKNDSINEPHRINEMIEWHTQRASFWARFAEQTKTRALAIGRLRQRNQHLVSIEKLGKGLL